MGYVMVKDIAIDNVHKSWSNFIVMSKLLLFKLVMVLVIWNCSNLERVVIAFNFSLVIFTLFLYILI